MVYKTLEAFPNGKKCLLCLTSVTDPEKLGEIYQSADVIIHYFCLLLASKVEQNGEDDKGILGFYPRDIKKEAKRAASIVCNYCKEGGACIFCVNENCSIAFHLPCGLDNGSYHHFFDGFDSFCKNHWKKQVIPAKLKKQVRDCVICSHPIIFSKEKYIWPPCCKPKALLHKRCTQRLASSAGYYMKCPLCNNKTDFCCGLRSLGVFIPEREASWEVEPHAFQELSQPIKECEAVVCKCPQGRTHCTLRSKNKKWCIEPCKLCGSIGIHHGCMQQQIRPGTFECSTCVGVSQRFTNNESGERGHEGEETIGSPENGEVMVEDYSSNPGSTSHESSDSEEFQEFRRARRRNREALSSNIILISSESEDEVSYDRSCPMPSPIRKSVPIRRRPQKRRTLQFVGESDGHQCSSTAVLSSVEESRTETETDGFPEVPLICNVFSLTSEEGRKSSETFELIDLYEGQHSYEFIEGQSMRQLEFEAAHSEEPTQESLPACENPPQTSSILQVNNVYNLSDAGFTLSLENKDTNPQVEPDVVSISDTESLRSSRTIIDIDSLIQSQLPLSEHFSKLAIAVAQQQSISKLKPKGKRKKKRTSVNSKKKKTIVNNSSTNDPIKTFSVNDKSSCNSVTDDLPGIEPNDVSNSSLIIEKQSVESQSSSNPTKHGRKDKKVLKVHSSLFNTNPLQKLNSGTDMNSDNDTPVALSKRRSRSDAAKEAKLSSLNLPRKTRNSSAYHIERLFVEQVKTDKCKEKVATATLLRKTRQATTCHSGRMLEEQAGINECEGKEITAALPRNNRDTSPSQCGRKSEEQVEPDECKEKEVIADLPRKTRQASACHSGRKSVEQAGMNEYKKKEVVTALLRNTRDTSPSQCGRKSEEQVEPDECKEKEVIADLPKKTRQASACHSGRKSVEQAGMNEYKEKEVATALPRNPRDTSSQCGRKSEEQVEPDECKEKEVIADLPRKTRQASAYHSGRMAVEQAGMNEYKEKEVATALPRNTSDTSPFHCGRKSVVQVEPHECKEKEVAIAVLPRKTRQASSPQCGRKSKEQIGMDESKEKEVTAVLPRYTRQASACQNGRISVEQVDTDECKEKEVIAVLPRKTRQASPSHCGRKSMEQVGMDECQQKEVTGIRPRKTRQTSACHSGKVLVEQVELYESKEKESTTSIKSDTKFESSHTRRKYEEQVEMAECREKEVITSVRSDTLSESEFHSKGKSVEQVGMNQYREKDVMTSIQNDSMNESSSCSQRKSLEQGGDECRKSGVLTVLPNNTSCRRKDIKQVETIERRENESRTALSSVTRRISASSCENNFIEQGVDESIEKAGMTYEKQDGTRRKKNLLGIRENFMNTSLGWEKERPEAYSCNKFYTQEVKALKINDELLDEHVQINVATESSKSSITELTEKCIYSNNLIVIDDKFNSSFIENSEMPLEKPDVMNDEHRGKSLLNVEESKLVLDKVEMGLVHMNPSSKVCLNEGGTLRRDRSSKKVKLCKRDSSLLNHNKTSYTHSASLFEEKQNNNAKEFKTAQLVQYDDVLTSKNINTVLDSNNDREQLGLYVLTDEKTSTELIEDYLEESGVPDNVTKSRHNEITDRKIQKLSHSKENKMRQPSGKGFRDEEVRTEGKVKGDKVSNKRKSVSSSLEVTNKRKRFEVRIDEKKGSRGHVATSKKTDKPVEAKVSSSTHLLITDDSITEDYAPDESERCSSSILFSPPQNDFTYKAFLPCSFLSAETSAEISDKLFSLEISRAVETNSDILLLQTEKERSLIEKTVDTNENRMLPNHLVADKTCSSIEENLESRTSAPRAITNCRSSSSGPSDVIPESQSNSSGASQAMPECHPSSSIPDCKTRNHEAINVISECETRSSIPSVTESSVPSEDISECQNSSSVPSQAMLECHKSSSGETHAPSVCETSTHGARHAISECETGSSASSHAIPEYRASSSVPCQVLPECHPYSSGESQDISVCETSHEEIHPFSEWETECSGASHAIPESHASSSGLSDANLTIRSIVAQPIPNLIDTHCTEGGSTSSSVSWYKCCSTGCPTCENSSVYLTGRIAENFKESQLLKETPLNDQFFLRNGSEVTSTYTHEAPRIKETHKKNCRKESVIALEPGERGSPDKYGSIKKDYLCHKKLEVPDLSDVKDILGRTDGCADKPVVHSTQRLCTLNPDLPPHHSDSTNNLVKMNSEKLNMIEFEANLETCLPNSDDSPSRSLDISSSNIANKKNDLVSAPEMKQFLTKITHDPLTSNIINVHEVSHDQKLTFVNQNSEQKDSSFNQEILKSKVLLSKNASYISSSEVTSTRSDDNSYCSNVENLNEESVIESSSINSSLVSSTVFDESRVNKYNDSPRSKDDGLQSDDNSSFLHSSLNKCSPNWYLPRVIRVHVCYELGEEDRSYRRGSSGKKTLLPGVEVLKPENSSYLRSYFLKAFLFMKPRVVKIFTDSHGFKYSQLFVENIPSFIRTTEVFQSDADLGAYLSSLLHDRDITQLTKPLLILITSADPNSTLKKNVFDLLKSVTRIRNIFLVVSTLLCTNSRTRQFNKKLCDLSRKYHYQVWDINKIAFKFRNKKNVNCF